MVVDIRGRGGLEDEDVLVTDRLVDLDRRLERQELGDMAWGELNAKSVVRSLRWSSKSGWSLGREVSRSRRR